MNTPKITCREALTELVALKNLHDELNARLTPRGNEVDLKRKLREEYDRRKAVAWPNAVRALAELE